MQHWAETETGGMHMSRSTRGTLLGALTASGLAVLLTLGTGSALADPDQPPPPGDPAAADAGPPPAPEAPAPPAPADPLAGPPGGPLAPPPGAQPAAAEGTPQGENPNPFVGEPPFVPPSFNPVSGS